MYAYYQIIKEDIFTFKQAFDRWIDEWMDDLRFYVLFNSILIIFGRWVDDNETLCA